MIHISNKKTINIIKTDMPVNNFNFPNFLFDFSRRSFCTSTGNCLKDKAIKAGTITRSSTHPAKGIKSGKKSIGLSRYSSGKIKKNLEITGILPSFKDKASNISCEGNRYILRNKYTKL